MTFYDAKLPERVAAGFQGGPVFNTSTEILQNGDEYRNKEWVYPKHRYSAELGLFNDEDREALIAAIWVCAGAWGTFRFKDWNDYTVTEATLTPVVGTMTPVQLAKFYTFGAGSFKRDLRLVTKAEVRRDGVAVAGSFSTTTGLFTPSANWEAGAHDWSGEFEVLVKFANDYNPLTARHKKARVTSVELLEVSA